MISRIFSFKVIALKLAEDDNIWRRSSTTRKTWNFLFFFLLLMHLTSASGNSLNLVPSGVLHLCPGSNITFVCTNSKTSVLAWRSFEQGLPEGDPYLFNYGSDVDMVERFSGSFSLVLISASPLISTATLTNKFGPPQNGANLTCSSTSSPQVQPTERKYAVLILKDLSAPLHPTFSQMCLTSAVLSWTAPNESTCVIKYTIILTNITEGNASYTYNTTTNTTSMTVIDLTQGAEYFFTVSGVDAEGRVGEESVESQSIRLKILSAPFQPAFSPKYHTSAVLSWTPPTEPTCITMYTITLTNATEGNTSYTYTIATNATSMTLCDLTKGAEYFFTVSAVDMEGRVGEESVPSPIAKFYNISAPLQPAFSPKCLVITSAVLSWTPPIESLCISIYTVTLINITEGNTTYIYNTATNTTSITVSGLTKGAEYFFTVAGVDADGRMGEESVPSQTLRNEYLTAPLQPAFSPKSLTSAVLSWTPPTESICIIIYTITLTNITEGNTSYSYSTTTNTTIMTVYNLTKGAEYFFTVAGVDPEGRVGEESVPSQIIKLDTPEAVTNIQYQHGSLDDPFVNIIVEWMPPTQSSRPPVIGYIFSYNATGSFKMDVTNDTKLSIKILRIEAIVFTVNAVNVLGNGRESSVTIYGSRTYPIMAATAASAPLIEDWHITVVVCAALIMASSIISFSIIVFAILKKKSEPKASRPTGSNGLNNQSYELIESKKNETTTIQKDRDAQPPDHQETCSRYLSTVTDAQDTLVHDSIHHGSNDAQAIEMYTNIPVLDSLHHDTKV